MRRFTETYQQFGTQFTSERQFFRFSFLAFWSLHINGLSKRSIFQLLVFCFETLPGRQAIWCWNIKWLLKLTADKMWVNRLQKLYSLNTKVLQPFWANVQTGKTKSKTHIEIKLCITVYYYNLVHSSATEKFRSLHKCLCPTFDMRQNLQFRLLYWKITSFLIDFVL